MCCYELPLSPNYVCNWGIKEAIREILQNSIDANKCGYDKKIIYNKTNQSLSITNYGVKLSKSSLVLGCSSKNEDSNMIGKFGEGYKLALIVLLRNNKSVKIYNMDEVWLPTFSFSNRFETDILNINVSKLEDYDVKDGLSFVISGINQEMYDELLLYFPCIDDHYGNTISSENGYILLDDKFKGKMYVEGLYIQYDENFKYGYNFNSDVVNLDRDRKAINYYELRKLTATAVLTAEFCSPELYKAINDSYTDIKDITDVLDDASDEFLYEYRDMFYKDKNLEQNTLVATESVMRQLKQMDLDVPIAKGTEIESYLIAKANDKLGLIYDAEEAVFKLSDKDTAWYNLENSIWILFKFWIEKYGKRLSEEGKKEFEEILSSIKPVKFSYIDEYIPNDFIWTRENFNKLLEEYKNQT